VVFNGIARETVKHAMNLVPSLIVHQVMAVLSHQTDCSFGIAAYEGIVEGFLYQSVISEPGTGLSLESVDSFRTEFSF